MTIYVVTYSEKHVSDYEYLNTFLVKKSAQAYADRLNNKSLGDVKYEVLQVTPIED